MKFLRFVYTKDKNDQNFSEFVCKMDNAMVDEVSIDSQYTRVSFWSSLIQMKNYIV